jgi:hypothetical protein
VSDPLRLSDERDPTLALLLRAGQKEMPPRRALEKTLAGLGAATTIIGTSHAAAAAVTAGKLGVWTLAKWAGAGVLSGLFTIGAVELVQHAGESSRTPPPTTAVSTPKTSREAVQPRRGAVTLPAPAPAPPSPAVEGRDVAAEKGLPQTRAAQRVEPAASESDAMIALEVALVDEARRALRAGRATQALDALNRYRSQVKRPRLGPETQYLEMEALFAAGNVAAARRAAGALLERHPNGPHAARARLILRAAEPRPSP